MNVREQPNINAGIRGTLAANQCVALLHTQAGWYEVQAVSLNGWSSAEFITQVNECPVVVEPVAAQAQPTAASIVPIQAAQQEQPTPTPVPPTATPIPQPAAPTCDPNYTGACIPLVGYDLDCPEVGVKDFNSVGNDPHGFDRDHDGLACES